MVYFKMMIQSTMCLVYHLMSPFGNDITTIDNYIKIWLQSVHHFEEYSNIFDTKASFMWYKRGNFLSLLNLPDQIKQFGSIRLYWEGTCERYIQYVKPLMTNMRNTPTYLAKQFHTLQQKNMMDHIMETVPNSDLNLKKYTRYNDMKIYSDVASVAEILQESEVFMCVYDTTQHELDVTQLYCIVKKNDCFYKVSIQCNDDGGMYHNGQ